MVLSPRICDSTARRLSPTIVLPLRQPRARPVLQGIPRTFMRFRGSEVFLGGHYCGDRTESTNSAGFGLVGLMRRIVVSGGGLQQLKGGAEQ